MNAECLLRARRTDATSPQKIGILISVTLGPAMDTMLKPSPTQAVLGVRVARSGQ